MRNDLALVSAHNHDPKIEPLFVIVDRYWSIRRERKETLTFTSLTFLFFWSLFLNYLFLLVYFIMELVAYFYGYSLHPWGSQYSIAAFNYVETSQRLSTYCWPSAISRCLRISNMLLWPRQWGLKSQGLFERWFWWFIFGLKRYERWPFKEHAIDRLLEILRHLEIADGQQWVDSRWDAST